MQIVQNQFNTLSNGDVIPLAWGNKMSFKKEYDDNITFAQYDVSQYDGTHLYAPTETNDISFWDKYKYLDYSERIMGMEWTREFNFPYSVSAAMADFTFNNTDDFFTPDPQPTPIAPQITNHSTNPSFETGSGTVEVRRNLIPNPSFETNISGWFLADGGTGTSSLLTRSTSWSKYGGASGLLTQNATTRVPEIRLSDSSGTTFPSGFTAGNTYTVTATTRYTQDIVGNPTRRPRILYGWSQNNGGSYTTLYSDPSPSQAGAYTLSVTFTIPANATGFILSLCGDMGQAPGYCWWDGVLAERIGTALPYFDGTTNDGFDTASLTPAWTGTANASASVLNGVAPVGVSSPQAPIWQSTDNPQRGAKIARALVKQASTDLRIRDTQGVAIGDSITAITSIRASRPLSVQPQWNSPTGAWLAQAGATLALSTEWATATRNRVTTAANEGLGFNVSAQPGDIIDIDNHMVVKGNYTGVYRDGYSQNWSWNGTPNASTSTGDDPTWTPPPIQAYMLPKRPVRLMAGYGSFNLQQFVGITEKAPTIDDLGKTASFHATDFLTEIFNVNINQVVAMENVRTDEVLEAILTQFGISPTSYQFSKGRNVIPFVFFDREKNAGNAIREIMQAEGGHLWIDEQGLIRFESRLPQPDTPSVVLDDEAVFELTQSGDTELINQIRIKSTIRRVASYREVYSNVKADRSALSTDGFVIPANSSRPYPADLADPCLTIEQPTVGENSSVSWFTAVTADGTDVSSNIVVTGSSHTQGQFVTFIQNNNPFPIEIDQIFLWGRPALVVDTINYLAKDQESIDKYEVQQLGGDEGITNDFFGSEANARSFAQTIIDEYKDFNQTIEATIVGNLALQLNDVVYLTARGNDSYYKIKSITVNMHPFSYKIKATRYTPRSWSRFDVTTYDSLTDVIAP